MEYKTPAFGFMIEIFRKYSLVQNILDVVPKYGKKINDV